MLESGFNFHSSGFTQLLQDITPREVAGGLLNKNSVNYYDGNTKLCYQCSSCMFIYEFMQATTTAKTFAPTCFTSSENLYYILSVPNSQSVSERLTR